MLDENVKKTFRAYFDDSEGECECPNCRAKFFWGSPTKEIQNAADKGELQIVASSIKRRNYCPQCKTLIFTMADYAKELKKVIGQSELK